MSNLNSLDLHVGGMLRGVSVRSISIWLWLNLDSIAGSRCRSCLVVDRWQRIRYFRVFSIVKSSSMPIYEYQCGACGHQFDKLQKFSDAPLTQCPECGKDTLEKLISAAAFHLKGSGWYKTDYAPKVKSESKDADASKTDASKSDASKSAASDSGGEKASSSSTSTKDDK